MSEDGSTRARLRGYEIQHIFAKEIATYSTASHNNIIAYFITRIMA